jgi:hypothetical protein
MIRAVSCHGVKCILDLIPHKSSVINQRAGELQSP